MSKSETFQKSKFILCALLLNIDNDTWWKFSNINGDEMATRPGKFGAKATKI